MGGQVCTDASDSLGVQIRTDASDSYDSVTEGVERCIFNGFTAAEALVAAFRFGLLGALRLQWMTTASPLAPRNHL